jgi:ParB family transcriptional regulator, chromosome partitioning protein
MPKVHIDQINTGLNRRAIDGETVENLKESIKANGLLNPITIDRNGNLIAGLHRLTACKLLGLEKIECNIVTYEDAIQARLAEIDENFVRNELSHLERSELVKEREQILERLGLRAKTGDNQHRHIGGEMISPPPKTTLELAKGFGYSERSLQHDKQIAKDIHPEVKEQIKGTPLADIKTELLKIARIGAKERDLAHQVQQALELAQTQGDSLEAERQAKLLEDLRIKQKELQMLALKSAMAQREAKSSLKKVQKTAIAFDHELEVQAGDVWELGRHLVYCGDTSNTEFRNLLPSNAALAIATLSPNWNHDYLVDEARVVAVLRSQSHIYDFCRRNRMPFQYEFVLSDIYVGIFSHQSISKPQTPINVEGVEGIIDYLVNLYTKPNNYAIAPFMGHGEILSTCQRLGRICFIGDKNPGLVSRGITRWQRLTEKQPHKTASSNFIVSS